MITIEPPERSAIWLTRAVEGGLARFLNRARAAIGLEGEVHVLLADDATLRRLNRTFRGKNKATDVLSFPAAPTTVSSAIRKVRTGRRSGDLAGDAANGRRSSLDTRCGTRSGAAAARTAASGGLRP